MFLQLAGQPQATAARQVGATIIAYGNTLLHYLFIAWVLFVFVKALNSLHYDRGASPKEKIPPRNEQLLMEIRDHSK